MNDLLTGKCLFSLPVGVDDQTNGLEKYSILGIGMLYLFRLGRLLRLVQYRLEAFGKSSSNTSILCTQTPII